MSFARSIPNILTLSRIGFSVLVFCALATTVELRAAWSGGVSRGVILAALLAFVMGAVTDYFDGWLARRLHAQSVWGTILDPIADKMAVLSVVVGLTWLTPRIGIVAPGFLILLREIFVSGLREGAAGRGVAFPVTKLAKWKTAVQLVALSVELAAAAYPEASALAEIGDGLLWIAAAMTLWTGSQYGVAAVRQLGRVSAE